MSGKKSSTFTERKKKLGGITSVSKLRNMTKVVIKH